MEIPNPGIPTFPPPRRLRREKEEPNPKNRTESVKYVPGLKCKTCPRLDTVITGSQLLCRA
jgi:hypothetical protein